MAYIVMAYISLAMAYKALACVFPSSRVGGRAGSGTIIPAPALLVGLDGLVVQVV